MIAVFALYQQARNNSESVTFGLHFIAIILKKQNGEVGFHYLENSFRPTYRYNFLVFFFLKTAIDSSDLVYDF